MLTEQVAPLDDQATAWPSADLYPLAAFSHHKVAVRFEAQVAPPVWRKMRRKRPRAVR